MERSEQFVFFLLRAKLKTYATGGEGDERNLEDGRRERTYSCKRQCNELAWTAYFGDRTRIATGICFARTGVKGMYFNSPARRRFSFVTGRYIF